MSEADPRVVAQLEAMSSEEVRVMIVKLTGFASWSIQTRTKWMKRPFLPKGYDAGAVASEAIARVLDPDGRQWKPERDPSFLDYLKSVVRSILWDLQKAAEKEALVDAGDDEMDKVAAPGAEAGEDLTTEELKDELLNALDTDEQKLVLMSMFDGQDKAAEIADSLGLDVERVYKLKWQIRQLCTGVGRSVKT